MKKTVLTFGLISGHRMALGYTIMVASFLLIYFGIRSYRDNTLAGLSDTHVPGRVLSMNSHKASGGRMG